MSLGVPNEHLECDALAFFAEFEAAAAKAITHGPATVAVDLAIGRSCVRLRFASAAFAAAAIPALDHLEAPPGTAPDATIAIWDSASTGVPAPIFPWGILAPRGTPVGFGHPSLRTIVDPDFGGVTMFDAVSRTGVVWAPSAAELPWWERAAPLRAALYWATVQPGQHFVHGGAVGGPTGGVLLAGRGGSGKSTLALACLEHGMGYAGDDYVLVTTSPGPVAHAVYRSAKVDPASLDLLPSMKAASDGAPVRPGDKAVLDVGRQRPAQVVSALPIAAIVNPRVTGAARPVLHRVSPRDALVTLAPSTVYQLPGDAGSALATMSAVARQVPSYVLEVGPDLPAAASLVAELAERRL